MPEFVVVEEVHYTVEADDALAAGRLVRDGVTHLPDLAIRLKIADVVERYVEGAADLDLDSDDDVPYLEMQWDDDGRRIH